MEERVLVIDENPENRRVLRHLLENRGFFVQEAPNAHAALALATEAPPRAVVLEVSIPGMDGFTFCHEWNKNEEMRKIPIILYTTTHRDPNEQQLALDLGATEFINAPCRLDELVGRVITAVERAKDRIKAHSIVLDIDSFKRRRPPKKPTEPSELSITSQHEAILESTPNAIITIDKQMRIQSWNPSAERIFGYTETEAIGRMINTLAPDTASTSHAFTIAKDGYIARYSSQYRNKEGNAIDVSVAITSLGYDRGFIVIISDRSALSKMVQEKARIEEHLATVQRIEALGRLAGGVAHDFNNLLTVILADAELLKNEPALSPSARDSLSRIREAAEDAAALTRQLLTFSRKQPRKIETLNVNAVILSTKNILERLIGSRVAFSLKLEENVVLVNADKSQIKQIITNIATNARDAMPAGGRFSIETKNSWIDEETAARLSIKPGEYASILFTDTGIGMDETTKAHVFDLFFTTKRQGKGTGLGLTTVQKIVQQHHGAIYADSRPNEGSIFTVLLPRSEKELKPRMTTAPPKPITKGTCDETILVVDDDDSVRELTKTILAMAGYRVLTASSGAEALLITEKNEIDLVVTDVIMPKMNGRQLAEKIHALKPSVEIIFTSGYASDSIATNGIIQDSIILLEKPFSASKLSSLVRSVLDKKKSR